MKHFLSSMPVLLLFSFLIACQEEERSKKPITDQQKINLELVNQDNVASFGAPPMIPVDHPVEIGEDVLQTENGGDVCLDCHFEPDEVDVPQTLHPERHVCMQCQIPTADETATGKDFKVDNYFIKHVPN